MSIHSYLVMLISTASLLFGAAMYTLYLSTQDSSLNELHVVVASISGCILTITILAIVVKMEHMTTDEKKTLSTKSDPLLNPESIPVFPITGG